MAVLEPSIIRDKRNEVFSEIQKAWGFVEDVIGTAPYPEIVYTMKDGDNLPDKNKGALPWARVTMLHKGAQATSISQRRYKNTGELVIEVFIKTNTTDSGNKVELLADFIKRWLRNYRGSVLLRDIAVISMPNLAGYSSASINAAFEYYEVNSGKNPV